MKFVNDLRQVRGFLGVLRFPPPIKTYLYDIAEILLKVALNTITPFNSGHVISTLSNRLIMLIDFLWLYITVW
jgi:hypothetical protein